MRILLSVCMVLAFISFHSAEELEDDIFSQSASIGPSFICAITQRNNYDDIGGQPTCWHDGVRGREKMTSAPKDETVVQIISGDEYGCGLNIDQRVVCWGSFKDIEILGFYTQISGANFYGCGIKVDNTIGCWGSLHVVPPTDGKYVQIDCHNYHCCALSSEGHPKCFGRIDPGGENKHLNAPIDETKRRKLHDQEEEEEDGYDDVEEIDESEAAILKHKFIKIAVAEEFSCGITKEKYGLCWGDGLLADHVPMFIPGPLKHLAVGNAGMCAIYDAATEAGSQGQSGVSEEGSEEGLEEGLEEGSEEGSEEGTEEQSAVSEDSSVKKDGIHGNINLSHYLDPSAPAEHGMKCWGMHLPTFLKDEHFKGLEIDQVVIGATSVCAVTMDSELKCWGHGKEVTNQPKGLLVA